MSSDVAFACRGLRARAHACLCVSVGMLLDVPVATCCREGPPHVLPHTPMPWLGSAGAALLQVSLSLLLGPAASSGKLCSCDCHKGKRPFKV